MSEDLTKYAYENPFTTLLLYGGKTAIDQHAGINEANAPVNEGANEAAIQPTDSGGKNPNTTTVFNETNVKKYGMYALIGVGSLIGLKLVLNLVR